MTTSLNLNDDLSQKSLKQTLKKNHHDDDFLYPSSDGKPLAESTEQYRWIVYLKENLEILFAAYSSVFIAADLLWYPTQVKKPPAPREAPDVMIIFGRPKGKRRSYRQWEEDNIAPQVVFEILSASNKTREGEYDMSTKFSFYENHGVEEYYIYDPDEFTLEGWLRDSGKLVPIYNLTDWISPRLGIRMLWQPKQELQVYYPNGDPFLNSIDLKAQADRAQASAAQAKLQASHAVQQAEAERKRASEAEERAGQAEERAGQAEERAGQAEERAQQAEAAMAALEAELAKLRKSQS
jgi:Uma2 family endonuclease